ncbi:hypothetical protein STTU_0811 [Streptomyces sp. Tu6071]|nr:hypothetical protein STTU_0811 [Streptomyces sp. Tu6071]
MGLHPSPILLSDIAEQAFEWDYLNWVAGRINGISATVLAYQIIKNDKVFPVWEGTPYNNPPKRRRAVEAEREDAQQR